MVNFIRSMVAAGKDPRPSLAQPPTATAAWKDDAYLRPVVEDDALLFYDYADQQNEGAAPIDRLAAVFLVVHEAHSSTRVPFDCCAHHNHICRCPSVLPWRQTCVLKTHSFVTCWLRWVSSLWIPSPTHRSPHPRGVSPPSRQLLTEWTGCTLSRIHVCRCTMKCLPMRYGGLLMACRRHGRDGAGCSPVG